MLNIAIYFFFIKQIIFFFKQKRNEISDRLVQYNELVQLIRLSDPNDLKSCLIEKPRNIKIQIKLSVIKIVRDMGESGLSEKFFL